jgi:enoyl-CoA hydratase/carnithine racemase
MTDGPVRVDVVDGVATVTVDNPPVNALANAVVDALADAASVFALDDTVRVIVLTGAGDKAFVAGADLQEFSQALGSSEWIEDHTARTRRMLEAWERIPQPVVAAVQASAVGGGLEIALVCDLIVADENARFGLPEVKLGLMPGAGGTQRLPRRIGIGPAKEMLLLGSVVTAAEAHRLHLVNRVASAGTALAEAHAIARRLALLSSVAVRAIKKSVDGADGDLACGLDRERALFMEVFGSHDANEGVQAFVEKRSPTFAHR